MTQQVKTGATDRGAWKFFPSSWSRLAYRTESWKHFQDLKPDQNRSPSVRVSKLFKIIDSGLSKKYEST